MYDIIQLWLCGVFAFQQQLKTSKEGCISPMQGTQQLSVSSEGWAHRRAHHRTNAANSTACASKPGTQMPESHQGSKTNTRNVVLISVLSVSGLWWCSVTTRCVSVQAWQQRCQNASVSEGSLVVVKLHSTGFARSTSNPSILPGHQCSVMQPEQPFSSEFPPSWEGQQYGTPRRGGATEL